MHNLAYWHSTGMISYLNSLMTNTYLVFTFIHGMIQLASFVELRNEATYFHTCFNHMNMKDGVTRDGQSTGFAY